MLGVASILRACLFCTFTVTLSSALSVIMYLFEIKVVINDDCFIIGVGDLFVYILYVECSCLNLWWLYAECDDRFSLYCVRYSQCLLTFDTPLRKTSCRRTCSLSVYDHRGRRLFHICAGRHYSVRRAKSCFNITRLRLFIYIVV